MPLEAWSRVRVENYPYHLTHTLVKRLTPGPTRKLYFGIYNLSLKRSLDQGSSLVKLVSYPSDQPDGPGQPWCGSKYFYYRYLSRVPLSHLTPDPIPSVIKKPPMRRLLDQGSSLSWGSYYQGSYPRSQQKDCSYLRPIHRCSSYENNISNPI